MDEEFEAWADILGDYEETHDTGGEFTDLSAFDWESFNAKGVVLAKRLKRALGPDYHIQYSKSIREEDHHAVVWVSPAGEGQ